MDYARARKAMVDSQLRTGGVNDRRILSAMGATPREEFVPELRRALSYVDEAVPVSPSRAMPTPAAFARLIQFADITAEDVVLDVACGAGYSSAVLAKLANGVVALEDDAALVEQANANLVKRDIGNAAAVQGALPDGVAREAPFDVIVIEGAVEAVPQALLDQLRDGGRLVATIGRGNAAVAHRFLRDGNAVSSYASFNLFMPALEAFDAEDTFEF